LSTLQDNSYKIEELRTIKDLRDIYSRYSTKEAWLFLSLGGFHGTKLTLDDLELLLTDQSDIAKSVNGRWWVTILVVWPEYSSASFLNFGEVMIDSEDIQWLRERVRETLKEVEASQYGNT
jgi:hypothetical protein